MKTNKWELAVKDLCNQLAKTIWLAEKGKNINTYVPNGVQMAEINVQSTILYNDIIHRYKLDVKE